MQDDLLADAIEQLLVGRCTPTEVRAVEGGASPAALWQALEESGFADALVPEAQGGAGLGLKDVLPVFEACGRHVLPLPLAQTLLARSLLARAGQEAPVGSIALAESTPTRASFVVGYGAVADWLLLADGLRLRLVDLRRAAREPLGDGSVDARLSWPLEHTLAFASTLDLRAHEALLLAAQMAGSMRHVFEVTLRYANERTQFGRSIGKFQAIQHQLSVMAEHTEAARMAVRLSCATAAVIAAPLACAVAKAVTSSAVVPVTAIAHAVHGAVGITAEYDLQLHTRRLHNWRVAAGSESCWNERVGRALFSQPQMSLPEFVRTQLGVAG